ncbi:hypothetical protein C0V77_10565 [Emticicia sp. TH156]|nr:hypothetical protein C0V77_10565 [Emticicia sp. TH156]
MLRNEVITRILKVLLQPPGLWAGIAAERLVYGTGNLQVWRFYSETPDSKAHSCSFTFIWFGTIVISLSGCRAVGKLISFNGMVAVT